MDTRLRSSRGRVAQRGRVARHARGEGGVTIIPRNGRFGVRVRDRSGRKRWLGTFDTEAEAQRVEARALLRPTRGGSTTVADWSIVWLSDYARAAPATRRTYRYASKRITDDLGSISLEDVDRLAVRRVIGDWPLNTVKVARAMFAGAIDAGLLDVNPFANLRLEQPQGRKDITALTEPEILALAETARTHHGDYGDEAAAIILTLAYTGVRPGELCALRRDDLDLERGELIVRFALDGTGQEKAPKNGKPRVIVAPPVAVDALRLVSVRMDSPYLFHSSRGVRLSKGSLGYLWRPVRAVWVAAGNAPLDLYALRHACATLLVQRGLPAHVVAQQLGHQDGGRLVMALYAHPQEANSRDLIRMAFTVEAPQRGRRSA